MSDDSLSDNLGDQRLGQGPGDHRGLIMHLHPSGIFCIFLVFFKYRNFDIVYIVYVCMTMVETRSTISPYILGRCDQKSDFFLKTIKSTAPGSFRTASQH